MKDVRKILYISAGDEFFQRRLGKSLDIHGVPAHEQAERLHMFRLTLRIRTIQSLCLIVHRNLCCAPAHRTGTGNIFHSAPCQVFCDLGNNHFCFIHCDPVTHSQLQFLHDTDVVDAGTAHSRPLQLHRLENCHRVDQPGPRRTPLNLQKCCLTDLIRPFKRKRIPRKLCR